MHIAIDAHMVGERETGNETYTLNLVRALLDLISEEPQLSTAEGEQTTSPVRSSRSRHAVAGLRLSLLATEPQRLATVLPNLPAQAAIVPVRPAQALLRIPLAMPWLAAQNRFDLLHVTYHAPPLKPCPTVVSVHDISFEHYPQFFSPRDLLILKMLVPLSVRRAARVVTLSQHAKREIVARYGLAAEKVAVTYLAAADHFQPVTDASMLQAVRRKYGLGDAPFVLALGNLQPRKNIGRLVEAFARMIQGIGQETAENSSPIPYPLSLVIAGKAQWRESQIYQAVTAAGLEGSVIFPGYVDTADLPALYSAAVVFVYPSLYEGFGLPPLEAMACGTPVISSNAASLPEVVGDAALTVDPGDTEALAQALNTVLTNPGLQRELQARGLRRAAQFSWTRCAAETLEIYREVCQEARHR